MLAAEDQARVSEADFRRLLVDFRRLTGVEDMTWTLGEPERVVLPAAPRPPDLPPPTPSPVPTADPSANPTPTGTPQPTPIGSPAPPDTPLDGPRLGLQAALALGVTTELFGEVELDRDLLMVASQDGWKVRWQPAMLFPELGDGGRFRLRREEPVRGSIVAQDGTVFARTREDGARVYPQEWLAGQTIGYATPATPDDVRLGERVGLRRDDLIGRSGLEQGADALLARHARLRPAGGSRRGRPRGGAPPRHGPRGQRDHHHSARHAGHRRCGHRRLQRGGHGGHRPAEWRRVGAVIGSALQPERHDHRHHPVRHAAGGAVGRRAAEPRHPGRLSGRLVVQGLHPGARR